MDRMKRRIYPRRKIERKIESVITALQTHKKKQRLIVWISSRLFIGLDILFTIRYKSRIKRAIRKSCREYRIAKRKIKKVIRIHKPEGSLFKKEWDLRE